MIQSHEMPERMVEVNGIRKYRVNVQEIIREEDVVYIYDEIEFDANIPIEISNGKIAKLEADIAKTNINTDYENQVKALTEDVPESEIKTWTKQETEARSWLVDNTTPTPLIDNLCEARGVDKTYLAGKIIEKADAYAAAIGSLTGLRQKQEDELNTPGIE